MAFQTYEDLEIYQLSHDLAIEIFDNIIQRYEKLGRKIYKFIKAVESGHKS